MPERDSKKSENPEEVRSSLAKIVQKLEPSSGDSSSWAVMMSEHRKEWEELKRQIHERQRALKELVRRKKAGEISSEEFDTQYRKLQDELTELEFQVYNLRLGTNVKLD